MGKNNLSIIEKYNWKEIQKYYDDEHSYRDITREYGVPSRSISKAVKLGLLKTRTLSEAKKISCRLHPYKHSEATKHKLSKIQKKYMAEHPNIPAFHGIGKNHKESYPEKYFDELFRKKHIKLNRYGRIYIYELDFYDARKKIDIEIDGEQHYRFVKTMESDKRKDKYLKEHGWQIIRIRWAHYCRLDRNEKEEVVKQIKAKLKNRKLDLTIPEKLTNKHYCVDCGKEVWRSSKRCRACSNKVLPHPTKIIWPTREELERLVWEKPSTHIAKQLGVSDSAVKKHCRKLEISKPKPGYWTKKRSSKNNRSIKNAVLPEQNSR